MLKHIELLGNDKKILRGYLNLPEEATKIVVMLHGFTGNKTEHNGNFRSFSRLLEKYNIASLRLDFVGNGESDGEFYDFDFEDAIKDAQMMYQYCRTELKMKEVIALGYSMGGAIASLSVTNELTDKLILWSPSANIYKLVESRWNTWRKLDNGNVYAMGFEMGERLVKSASKFDMYQNVDNYKNPVIVIHGKEDQAVNYTFGVEYANRYSNSKLELIDDCGHGYDQLEKKLELFEKTLTFII